MEVHTMGHEQIEHDVAAELKNVIFHLKRFPDNVQESGRAEAKPACSKSAKCYVVAYERRATHG